MNEAHVYNLIIDEELKRCYELRSKEDYAELQHNITYTGCSKPIIIWNKLVVDDFDTYEICHRLNVPFKVVEKNFISRNEVIAYICRKTLKQKNLVDEKFRYCIGKLYEAEKAILTEKYPVQNQYTPPELRRPYHVSGQYIARGIFSDNISISSSTVYKYGLYAAAIDRIYSKEPEIGNQILIGEFHISHNNTIKLANLSGEEICVIYNHVKDKNNKSMLCSEVKRGIKRDKEHARKKANMINEPEIKQIPKYDPDAEIASLTLTIPTWISSIKRTQSIADFKEVTTEALYTLEKQLISLKQCIAQLEDVIKEEYHE